MLIGVTGQIGCGKSTAADMLSSLGAQIIDADKLGKKVTGSREILDKLVKLWGESIRTPRGRLRPAIVAKIVFSDESGRALKQLNGLVHPALVSELMREIDRAELREPKNPVLLDAALLPLWDFSRKFDLVILVTTRRDLRIKRLRRRGLSDSDIVSRMNSQIPLTEYRRIANLTVENNAGQSQLKSLLKKLWADKVLPQL